jgi:hypothetical protein
VVAEETVLVSDGRATARRLAAVVLAAGVLAFGAAACGDGGPEVPESIQYVGNPDAIYYADCRRVDDPPAGHIVEIESGQSVIDATNDYLPDGLKVTDSDTGRVRYADCSNYSVVPRLPEMSTIATRAAAEETTTTTTAAPARETTTSLGTIPASP